MKASGKHQLAVATKRRCTTRIQMRPVQVPNTTKVNLRKLIELVPDAVVVVSSQDGSILFANRLTEALFGYTREELLGQPIERLIPERFHVIHQQHRATYSAHPHLRPMGLHLGLFGRRQDSSEFPVEISLGPLDVAGEVEVISTIRDISERKRAEQVLRDTEQKAAMRARELEAAFDVMADGVVVYDHAARILQKNGAAHALLGTDRHPEILDLPVQERVAAYAPRDDHGQPVPWEQWPVVRVLRGETFAGPEATDLYVRTLDGREIEMRVSGAPMRDAAGHIIGAVCVLRDVTERRRLERRTHDALHALLATAETLVRLPNVTMLADGIETPAASIERQLANLTHSVLGCSFVSVIRLGTETGRLQPLATVGLSLEQEREWHVGLRDAHLDDRLRDPDALARLRAGEALTLDLTQPPFDALPAIGRIATRLMVPVLMDNKLIGLLSINDIRPHHLFQVHEIALTRAMSRFAAVALEWERLLAERQAHTEAEARLCLLQALVEELPCAVSLVSGRDARLILANRGVAEVFGAPWPEGEPFENFLNAIGTRILDPNGLPMQSDDWATLRAARHGEAVRPQQTVIRHGDGTRIPVLVNAVPLDPRLLPRAGEAHESLVLTVRDDVTAIKEGERLKDEFVAMAAHELRNPVTAVRAAIQLLDRRAQRGTLREPAAWQGTLRTLLQTTDRLAHLIDDLLDVTRLQAGRLMLRQQPCDLIAMVRCIIQRQQLTTERHNLILDANGDHIIANLDAQRIEQVLVNLVNNAIKYSPDGGEIVIALDERREPGVVELRIRDHGIGIPAAYHSRIFDRFARADNAREREIQGSGLGLYLCRELIECHGGRIWFESREGKGTTFCVTIPLGTGAHAL